MSYTIEHPSVFLRQALYFACRHSDSVVLLNGNSLPYNYDSFPVTLAFGIHQEIKSTSPSSFINLKNLHSNSKLPIVGFLGYDLKNEIEKLSSNHPDPIGFPDIYFFEPTTMIRFEGNEITIDTHLPNPDDIFQSIINYQIPEIKPIPEIKIESRFNKTSYTDTIKNLKNHIYRGDIYEINFCIDFFSKEATINPIESYLELNKISPMPFSSFVKTKDKYLLCASPERFIKKTGKQLISQPIKGTARRGVNLLEDNEIKSKLAHSEKERAENVMIVDLVRNDLSHTAKDGSVAVTELCGIYTFPQVHQMISTITATQSNTFHFIDTLEKCFPMGSMTGAPKINAMNYIEQYEKVKRGLFSGSVGYITPDGDFDFNVVIRSILYNQSNNYLSFQAGSAITSDAEAEKEWEECAVKTKAIREVLSPKN